MRESVVIYQSFFEPVKEHMSDEQLGQYFRALMEYAINEVDADPEAWGSNVIGKIAYDMAKPQIEANFRRQDCGAKGGRPKATEEAEEPKEEPKEARFRKPTEEEVKKYCEEKDYDIDASHFVSHYDANGWKVGRNSMKDWKAAVRNWARMDKERRQVANYLPDDRQRL